MTIVGNVERERKSKKLKEIADENAPLLPTKRQEEGFDEFNGASFSGAIFNLSTTIVGSGIMALPATMKVLGLVLGIVMIVLMALLTERSIHMLLKFSKAGTSSSYGGVMEDSFGKPGRILLQVTVVVNNIAGLVVFMIIIGDVLSGTSSSGIKHHAGVLEGWFGSQWWNRRLIVLLVTSLCVFVPLASLKRIDSLKYTSTLSVGLAVVFLVIMVGIAVIKLITGTVMMPRLLPNITDMNSFLKLFTAVPVLVVTYICHYNVHSIDNELEGTTQIKGVVRSALALCSSVYVMTSFFGFLLFGEGILDDVLANFDIDLGIAYSGVLSDVIRVSYAAHLMLVFPIILYPLRLNIDGLCFPSSSPLVSDNKRFAFITIILICIIFLGANFIPNIWVAFQFAGATVAVCLGFIFPASITLRDRYGIATTKEKSLAIGMIVLAVFSNVVAIYSDVYALLNKNDVL